jgi:hypothetical protein
MATSQEEWVCRENLKLLRRQLQEVQDRHGRDVLDELIAQERAKLDRLLAHEQARRRPPPVAGVGG